MAFKDRVIHTSDCLLRHNGGHCGIKMGHLAKLCQTKLRFPETKFKYLNTQTSRTATVSRRPLHDTGILKWDQRVGKALQRPLQLHYKHLG